MCYREQFSFTLSKISYFNWNVTLDPYQFDAEELLNSIMGCIMLICIIVRLHNNGNDNNNNHIIIINNNNCYYLIMLLCKIMLLCMPHNGNKDW